MQRLRAEFAASERHACELMSIPRSSCRYRSRRDDSELRQQLIELAQQKPRFGYRRLHILLRRKGQRVNHKRVQRVYRAAGLCVRRIRRKRLTRSYAPSPKLSAPNQEWAIDFASDVTASGQAAARVERGGCFHARMPGSGNGYQPAQPARDASATGDRRTNAARRSSFAPTMGRK